MALPLTIRQVLSQSDVFTVDDAVIEALPHGVEVLSIEHFGKNAWTITGKIIGVDGDATERHFFIKVAHGQAGRIMLRGEHESSQLIYEKQPDFIPKPIAFGKYHVAEPEIYFYLSGFVNMDVTTKPDPAKFTAKLAEMHKLNQSPTGKFGFHVATCDGITPHAVDWEESWAVFYRNMLLRVAGLDLQRNGPWPKFERALHQVAFKVIPLLLEPLQADGGTLKPCLIHGDLWDGNAGINSKTKELLLFDASSYYAHNEMELGHWRCEFSSVFRLQEYKDRYLEKYPAAEPVDQFDDRNRLYSLKGAINYSSGHPDSALRDSAYNNMCYLCEKYAPIEGIDRYNPQLDPSITGATIVPHAEEECFEYIKLDT
ncbi:Fructosamine kinase-domain-containing protein [Astrocystis sublimbata]|nr:Fructosamine kinase-domain-containing protein [Astrocystis sublimbata]